MISHPFKLTLLLKTVQVSVLGLTFLHSNAYSASLEVNSITDLSIDDGQCTLREAVTSINNANVAATGCINTAIDTFGVNDRVTFSNDLNSANNTVTLTQGQIDVESSNGISIEGSGITVAALDTGETVIDRMNSRIFRVSQTNLNIDEMTITGGVAGFGAGVLIIDSSNVNISNSTIMNNEGFDGVGITVFDNSSLTLMNSTVSGNNGSDGAGVLASTNSSATLINSTVSGNTAAAGGGLFVDNDSNIRLVNSTVSNNIAKNGGGLFVFNDGSVTLVNSIVANSQSGNDCFLEDESSSVLSDTGSIIEDGTCGGNARIGDPGLLPLADNGGATLSHALQVDSIARDTGVLNGASGSFGNCTISDQRGQLRDDGDAACDVGAIEFNVNDSVEAGFSIIPLDNGKVVVVPL